MTSHDIPENAKNSDIVYLIDEYVRSERDRNILKDHWFHDLSFYDLAEKYDISLTTVKKVIYGPGDKILLKLN